MYFLQTKSSLNYDFIVSPQPAEGSSLLEAQDYLKHQAESMKKKRAERQKRFNRLVEIESSLCKALGQQSKLLPLQQARVIPSAEEMQDYRQCVEAMDQLKVWREGASMHVHKCKVLSSLV